MLIIETNSISNMGCQKLKIVRSLRYSGYLTNTSCVCQVSFFSAHLDNKQKSFFPKKIGVLLFKTVRNQIFWIVTRVSTHDYTVYNYSFFILYGPHWKVYQNKSHPTWCVAGISKQSNNKQKSVFPKKNGMLVFETLKNQKSDFLNSNTC